MVRSRWKNDVFNKSLFVLREKLVRNKLNKYKNDTELFSIKESYNLYNANSKIYPEYVGLVFSIYIGNRFYLLRVKKEMVGYSFRDFRTTKKIAKFFVPANKKHLIKKKK